MLHGSSCRVKQVILIACTFASWFTPVQSFQYSYAAHSAVKAHEHSDIAYWPERQLFTVVGEQSLCEGLLKEREYVGTMPRAEQEQEQYGPRGVATPMLASRSSKSGRVTATTLEHKGLTQTGVRMYVNKSDEEPALKAWKDAAARALEGVESTLQESPGGDRRDGRHVVRVVPCAPKVPHAPKESRSRTTAEMRQRKYFFEAQPGAAETEQRSTESGRRRGTPGNSAQFIRKAGQDE